MNMTLDGGLVVDTFSSKEEAIKFIRENDPPYLIVRGKEKHKLDYFVADKSKKSGESTESMNENY